jgi:DNA-binding response OmpR family regulator
MRCRDTVWCVAERNSTRPGVAPSAGPGPRIALSFGPPLRSLVAAAVRHISAEVRDGDVEEVARLAEDWRPHLLIFDLDRRPGLHHVVPALSAIALTRKRDVGSKVDAMEDGVDDLIQVPFTLDEILLRVYACLRRTHGLRPALLRTVAIDSIRVDIGRGTARLDGTRLDLTVVEQSLLYLLAANAGETLSREEILRDLWGETPIGSNVIDRHVRDLRIKLADDWRMPRYIETLPGRGYRWIFKRDVTATRTPARPPDDDA